MFGFDVLNSLLGNMMLAEVTVTPIDSSAWGSVITALTSQISVETVVGVLAVVAGACVGLAFMWWGLRKAISALMSAFKKGKISV